MSFIDRLKNAFQGSGFRLATDEELEAFIKESNEYHESAEGRANQIAHETLLKDYLKNTAKYKFTEEMGEISGFGGGYEDTCQCMLDAGLQWLDQHPNADPQFSGYKNVYGLINEDNEDAKALTEAIVAGSFNDCTGAMVHAVTSSVMWIRKNGWDEYVKAMSKDD